MEHIGPFTFNGIRFALGALVLIPFLYFKKNDGLEKPKKKFPLMWSLLTGCVLFLGASFQQMGIVHTSAGKAGFITGTNYMIDGGRACGGMD